MPSLRSLSAAALAAAVLLGPQSSALAQTASTSRTLVIGVDWVDPDNQQPDKGRVFDYTDFFTRAVRVRSGDTLDFRTAPNTFHVIAIARNEYRAKVAYPVALLDEDDAPATGTGLPKLLLGPGNGAITGGSEQGGGSVGSPVDFPSGPCGFVQLGQTPCTFNGGTDVEGAGGAPGIPPSGTDWQITMNAEPGTYTYFCYIHPGMDGTVTVVKPGQASVTSQADIDAASVAQFQRDRDAALASERAANQVSFSGFGPGKRTYKVSVGTAAADSHVAIDEMLPQRLDITAGDAVDFKWRDPHEIHTVGFPGAEPPLPGPFGPEFEAGEPPEIAIDPGNAPKGTLLTRPDAVVDSGGLAGTGYHLQPTVQFWGVSSDTSTKTGAYQYQCTIHDWMHGVLNIAGGS